METKSKKQTPENFVKDVRRKARCVGYFHHSRARLECLQAGKGKDGQEK